MNTSPKRPGMRSIVGFFAIALLVFSNPVQAQLSKPIALIKGEVRSTEDQSTVSGLQVAVISGSERIATSKTNVDGKFTAIVPPGGTYRLSYTSQNYAFREDTIQVPAADKYQEVPVRTTVMPLRDNQDLTPRQPLFAKGSSKLDPVTSQRLDELASLVRKNPRMKLEISVYPDMEIRSKKDAAQEKLLQERSNALRQFFLNRNAMGSVTISSLPTLAGSSMAALEPVAAAKKGKKSKPAAATKGAAIAQSVRILGRLS
jgi:outer membrane protein OmpA-like peptidoglycan-associated protein